MGWERGDDGEWHYEAGDGFDVEVNNSGISGTAVVVARKTDGSLKYRDLADAGR